MVRALLASVLVPAAGGIPPTRMFPPGAFWDAILCALDFTA